MALTDSLDELITSGAITPQLAMKVLQQVSTRSEPLICGLGHGTDMKCRRGRGVQANAVPCYVHGISVAAIMQTFTPGMNHPHHTSSQSGHTLECLAALWPWI